MSAPEIKRPVTVNWVIERPHLIDATGRALSWHEVIAALNTATCCGCREKVSAEVERWATAPYPSGYSGRAIEDLKNLAAQLPAPAADPGEVEALRRDNERIRGLLNNRQWHELYNDAVVERDRLTAELEKARREIDQYRTLTDEGCEDHRGEPQRGDCVYCLWREIRKRGEELRLARHQDGPVAAETRQRCAEEMLRCLPCRNLMLEELADSWAPQSTVSDAQIESGGRK